ncbi:hypothetical protein TIFTF001_022862 [Ficus carica]|uniref:CSC1-like protein At3g54510 n=1 Tax=Ficus carica TaxID=3494 RepID=A0AA88AF73_FICCA|nr:hypothetical protein TIFTF001_022862 [Ficus carica]
MDAFTISNISRGSDRLWIHFACLWFVSLYALYLLYTEYNEILIKRIQQLQHIKDRSDQFTVLVREIPICPEHKARACSADHFFSKYYPHDYHSYQILYNGKDVEELMSQAKSIARKINDLKERSVVKQTNRGTFLLDKSDRDKAKLAFQEEKLEEVRLKINQLQGESTLKQKELPVAFVTFKSRLAATLVAQSQQHSHPLSWIASMAPEPRDVSWRNLAIPYRLLPLCRHIVFLAATLLTIFFAIPVTAVQGIAKFEKLKKWFPPAMAIQLIPGLSSVVTGYLPSAILNGFIYIVPFAMLGMAMLAGSISKSKEEIKTCNMAFYFLVGNVFFLSLLSGSLLDQIGESFSHPKDIPTRLASAVSAQVIVSPLLLPFLIGYFCLGYLVFINQIKDVYNIIYETCGEYWPQIHHYILIAVILMQITMIGLFGLKSKPAASVSTIPLLVLTLMFNEYCKIRFLPSFRNFSVQSAKKNDELDVKSNRLEANYENASTAYSPPCLQPLNFAASGSTSTQPFVSS